MHHRYDSNGNCSLERINYHSKSDECNNNPTIKLRPEVSTSRIQHLRNSDFVSRESAKHHSSIAWYRTKCGYNDTQKSELLGELVDEQKEIITAPMDEMQTGFVLAKCIGYITPEIVYIYH